MGENARVRLTQLVLKTFRNYERCELEFPPGLVWIVGPNASGKTNLLEAIHFACTATSPRTRSDAELVRWGCDGFAIDAFVAVGARRHHIAVRFGGGRGKEVRLDGVPVARRSQLLEITGAVCFEPDDLDLVKGSPGGRRRLIDRLGCYGDRVYAADLVEFAQLLEQRNHLLRDVRARRTAADLAGLFDDQYLECVARLRARRLRTLMQLEPLLQAGLNALGGREPLSLRYLEDGHEEHPLRDETLSPEYWVERGRARLQSLAGEERQRGQTLWGPQRDDVRFLLDGRDARAFASQGQQRSLVLAVKHAEIELLERALGSTPLLLLDDVFSELDGARSAALWQRVLGQEQVFVTSTDAAGPPAGAEPAAVYRVRSGRVERVAG
ncbi:MAG TPA: DNA replication/repair protein RecF [Bacillota bacterium]